MKQVHISHFFSLMITFALLVAPLPITAIAQDYVDKYIYLGAELSDINRVITSIKNLDDNENSILAELHQHIEDGFFLGDYSAVVEALEYAEGVLQRNYNQLSRNQAKQLSEDFDFLVNKVLRGDLNANAELLQNIEFSSLDNSNDMTTRSHCPRTVVVNENLEVACKTTLRKHLNTKQGAHIQGKLKVNKKAKFKDEVTFKDDVCFEDDVTFKDDVEFQGNAIIEGGLIVTDLVVLSCMDSLCVDTLSVNDIIITGMSCLEELCIDNLSVTDAFITNATIGNLMVTATVLDQVINNLTVAVVLSVNDVVANNLNVNNISVVDQTVTGTLSVNNQIVNNLTTTNISATDAVVQNLQVNNISVTDQTVTGTLSVNNQIVNNLTTTNISATDAVVQNLQVTNVSVTDQTVTGTLSVNNEIVTNLTATNFSSTDAVIQDLTVTNCMGSLCVNSLSIVDQSISGSLSVNNEVINGNLTIPAFTPAGVVHNNGSGLLSSSLIVNADITNATISNAKLATISSADIAGNIVVRDGSGNFATNMITLNGTVTNPTDAATKNYVDTAIGGTGTSLNTPNTLVLRNGSGNFAAGTITANLSGNATTATTATNFSGALAGEVTGTQGATVVSNAVSANTASAVVRRTATGGFSAGTISMTDGVASGNFVLTTATSTAGAGNILKGGNRFIHNFGSNNTFMGLNAGNFTLTGQQNVGVGEGALSGDTSGYENTAVGYRALIGNNTGFYNVAVGTDALFTNSSGQSNTAIGWNALLNNNTGSRNTAIGTGALLGTGSDNIAIGNSAGASVGAGSFNIYIGNTGAAEGNTIRIGTTGVQFRNFQAGIQGAAILPGATQVFIDANDQLGTAPSSRRYKHNIEDMGAESASILELRPVTFAYNSDASETKQYGLIAEEVDEVFPGIVVRNADGQVETVQYHVLPVLLLNEMQKQQTTIQEISQAVTILQGQMQQLIN